MKFTIAIPTHNNEDTIEDALKSALNVDFDDFEVLISDTSNNDHTQKIVSSFVKDYEKKVKYFRNPFEWNMWQNHNFLLNEAKGDYVLFIHSDDSLLDDCLRILDLKLQSLNYPKRIVLCGESLLYNFHGLIKDLGIPSETILSGSSVIPIFLDGGLTPSGTLFSKDFSKSGYLFGNYVPSFSDCISMLYIIFKGYRFYFYDNIIFIRSFSSYVYSKLTKNDSRGTADLFNQYFTYSQLKIIIDFSFSYEAFGMTKFLFHNQIIKGYMKKRLRKRILKKPWLLFSKRYLQLIKYDLFM